MVVMVVLQTAHIRVFKIGDIPITQHHLDHHIQTVINEAFTIEGHTGLSNWFHSTSSNPETPSHARETVYEGDLLFSVMLGQTMVQAALAFIEVFDGTKSKFGAWMELIKKCSTNIKMQYA